MSRDFPVTDSPLWKGEREVFITKFSPVVLDVNPLGIYPNILFSIFLGGTGNNKAYALALDAAGQAYLTGYTYSSDFPTRNPLQAAVGGMADAFVTKPGQGGVAMGALDLLLLH